MNWTSFKRSPVLKEHFFPYPNGKLLTPGLTVSQLLSFTDVTVRAVWRNPIMGHKCGFFRSRTAWHVSKLEQVEIWFYSDCIHQKVKLSSTFWWKNVWRPSVHCIYVGNQICHSWSSRGPEEALYLFEVNKNPRWLSSPLIGRAIFSFLRSTVYKVNRHWTEVNFTGPNNKNSYYL